MTRNLKQPPGQIIAECDALIFEQAEEIRRLAPDLSKKAARQSRKLADKMYQTIQVKRVAEGAKLAAWISSRDPRKSV